jgi:hypothetical protein
MPAVETAGLKLKSKLPRDYLLLKLLSGTIRVTPATGKRHEI